CRNNHRRSSTANLLRYTSPRTATATATGIPTIRTATITGIPTFGELRSGPASLSTLDMSSIMDMRSLTADSTEAEQHLGVEDRHLAAVAEDSYGVVADL